jgi:16S rRNA (guanine(966)-N(2))-methyltransferase RsmD
MRIAGGIARGRRLAPPAIPGARPTSELIRGVIFNSLGSQILENARVADLYAGVGSLGIESLSRGAAFADFVEKDPRQCAVIRRNLKTTGLEARATVHRTETLKALKLLKGPYAVVLMDPPYRMESLDQDIEAIDQAEIIENNGMLVVGHSKRLALKKNYGKLSLVRSRRHGDSVVDFFRYGGAR